MKKLPIYIGILVLFVVGVYVYFTATNITLEVQEASPLQIKDNMGTMTAAEKEQFEKEVVQAKEKVMVMDDQMAGGAALLAQGEFKPRAHDVAGKALLIQSGDSKVLRFEDFETSNGPDLHIWLASSLGDEDYVDLGPIKATKGNVNYDVPAEVDITKYNKVLVWCVPFRVLFSYAELM
ncbi:MAG: DM13 domain-containing protein [Nanoarchaeota archaeon]